MCIGCELGFCKFFSKFCQVLFFAEEELLVGIFEGAAGFFGESAALESDEVQAANDRWVAVNDGERGDVLNDFGAAANEGVFTDPAELMGSGQAGNNDMVTDVAVASQGSVVGKDAVATDLAVMGNVGV